MKLELVTGVKQHVDCEVDNVHFPGASGELGILPGHAPLLTTLGTGELKYRSGAKEHYMAVSDGFAEVLSDRILILADTAENPHEIDVNRAEKAFREAAEDTQKTYGEELQKATSRLKRALNRLSVAKRIRSG